MCAITQMLLPTTYQPDQGWSACMSDSPQSGSVWYQEATAFQSIIAVVRESM